MSDLLKKILIEKRSIARLFLFLFFDFVLISLAVFLAFFLRFEGEIPGQHYLNMAGLIVLALLVSLPIFYFLRLYSFTWVYVSAEELVSLFRALGLSFLITAAAIFLFREETVFVGFPRSTLFISYFLIFIFSGGIRFAKRVYLQIYPDRERVKKARTLIVGAGDAGEQLLRSILSFRFSPYLPVGFVDDNPGKQGSAIHGIKVLGEVKKIPQIVRENKIESLIVALPSAGAQIIRGAVELGRRAGLRKIKIIPPLDEIMTGRIGIGNLREVEMEDLLDREPVSLDQKQIEEFIQGRKVLITGAAGSIGSELSRQVAKFKPAQLLVLDQDETGIFNITEELEGLFPELKTISLIGDVQDRARIERVFSQYLPQIVFHAAAYKHVPLMESHPEEAVKNNILGTKVVAETAHKEGVEKLVFISTDKAVNPNSVMGTTKRIGEMICQSLRDRTKFISVRFGNVLNSRGSVVPIFREQIRKGGPVEITHPEMKRYFMTIPEACLLVLQAGAMGQGGEVFVLDMGNPVKIIDLAKELIRLSGLEPDKDIPIVFTEPRPGEKFFEEILTAEEGVIATKNQRIFQAKLSEGVDREKLDKTLEELKSLAERGDKEGIINKLKELVPNYHG